MCTKICGKNLWPFDICMLPYGHQGYHENNLGELISWRMHPHSNYRCFQKVELYPEPKNEELKESHPAQLANEERLSFIKKLFGYNPSLSKIK